LILRLADVENGEADYVVLGVHLFHDGVVVRRAKVTLLLLKEDLQVIAFAVVPDGYVVGDRIAPCLMASMRTSVSKR
jgi:hypothetical protein